MSGNAVLARWSCPHGEPLEVNEEQFNEIIRESKVPVLMDFWAAVSNSNIGIGCFVLDLYTKTLTPQQKPRLLVQNPLPCN